MVFSFVARIARTVSVPVTADLEASLRLTPSELVERMLDAGAVGCNLEDTDHRGDHVLVNADLQAAHLREVRAASEWRAVHVVVNARADAFIHQLGDRAAKPPESSAGLGSMSRLVPTV